MKTQARFFLAAALCVLWGFLQLGCSSPSQTRQAAKQKLEGAKEAQEDTQLEKAKKGVVNVDAGRRLLQKDPAPSTNSVLAERRLDSAMVALQSAGLTPSAEDLIQSRKAVDALLSSNAVLYAAASNHFDRIDKAIVVFELRDRANEEKIKLLETKLDKIDNSNASDADTLHTIKKWLWWVILAIAAWALIKVGWQVIEIWGLFNPAVKFGSSIVKMPVRALADGFAEVIKGGENFKNQVTSSTDLSAEQRNMVLKWFRDEQQKVQDPTDTSSVIRRLTMPVG